MLEQEEEQEEQEQEKTTTAYVGQRLCCRSKAKGEEIYHVTLFLNLLLKSYIIILALSPLSARKVLDSLICSLRFGESESVNNEQSGHYNFFVE